MVFLFISSQYEQALKGFMRSKNVEGFINVNCGIDALARAAAHKSKGIIHPHVSVAQLAFTFAKIYCKYKDKTKLLRIIEYMPDASQKIRFLKEANLFSKAVEVHIQQGQYTEAYQILTAQARHEEGIKLAEKQGDERMMARFTIQKAVSELLGDGSLNDPDTVDRLQHIAVGKNTDLKLKSQACLLLGRSKKDSALCKRAFGLYRSFNPSHGIGEVESFNAFTELKPQSDKPLQLIWPILEACKAAKSILKAIEFRKNPTASNSCILEEVEDFYSLQKQGESDVYIFPKSLDLWAKFVECSTASSELDADGMLKLDAKLTLQRISEHLNTYLTKWMVDDCMNVCQASKSRLTSFPFHKPLCEGGFLQQSFTNYSPGELNEYVLLCLLALDTVDCGGKLFTSTDIKQSLLNLFSPQAAVHLPVGKPHLDTIRGSELAYEQLEEVAAATLRAHFKMDPWFEAWRIYCAFGKGTQKMKSVLNKSQRRVTSKAKASRPRPTSDSQKPETLHQPPTQEIQDENSRSEKGYKPPPAFVYYAPKKNYNHIFFLFLKSCEFIHSGEVLSASKLVLHIVKTIANRTSLASTISVTNLVNIACIHSIALLGLATRCYFLLKQPSTILVPHTYKHIAQVFDDLNCQSQGDKWLLPACMEDATVQKCPKSDIPQLIHDILELLQLVLDLLLGRYNKNFHVLRYAIRSEHCLLSGEAKHCLILILTLFGNLGYSRFWSDQRLHDYQGEIFAALVELPNYQTLQSLKQAQNIFSSVSNVSGSFLALSKLLASTDRGVHLHRVTVVHKQKKLELTPFRQQLPQRPMISMSIHQQLTLVNPPPPHPPSANPRQLPIKPLQGGSHSDAEMSTDLRVLQKWYPEAPSQSPPGSTHMQSPPGSTHVQSPPGSTPMQSPPGSTPMQSPPGSTPMQSPGSTPMQSPPGSTPMQSPPGSTHAQSPPGSTPMHSPPGSTPMQSPMHLPPGSTPMQSPPGSTHEQSLPGTHEQSPPVSTPMQSLPSPHKTFSQAVQSSHQMPVAHAHPLTAHSSTLGNSHEVQATVGLSPWQQEQHVVSTPEMPQILRSMSYPEPEGEEQDQDENIIDEHFGELQTTEATAVGGGHVHDHSMIDENLCRFCGEPLTVRTYQDHVESDHHKNQERLYNEFSQEVTDWEYSQMTSELKKILNECKAFDEAMIDSNLDLVLTDIKNVLDVNEKRIEEIKRSCDWRNGLLEVQSKMVKQMESLIDRGKQEQKRTEQQIEQATKEQLLQEDLHEEIGQAGPVSMEQEKAKQRLKKRQYKKNKK